MGLHELTFVDSVLLVTVFDLHAVRGKFSCKNIPKFTAKFTKNMLRGPMTYLTFHRSSEPGSCLPTYIKAFPDIFTWRFSDISGI